MIKKISADILSKHVSVVTSIGHIQSHTYTMVDGPGMKSAIIADSHSIKVLFVNLWMFPHPSTKLVEMGHPSSCSSMENEANATSTQY